MGKTLATVTETKNCSNVFDDNFKLFSIYDYSLLSSEETAHAQAIHINDKTPPRYLLPLASDSSHTYTIDELRDIVKFTPDDITLKFPSYIINDIEGNNFKEKCYAFVDTNRNVTINLGYEPHLIRYLFRGENESHCPCVPSLYRVPPNADMAFFKNLFIKLLQRAMFMDLLLENACKIDLYQEILQKLHLPVNLQLDAIAQHYGYPTDILDLSSNLEVALFFATSFYKDGKYYPARSAGDAYIYVVDYAPMLIKLGIADAYDIKEFQHPPGVIGLQPLLRPASQRGFGVRLAKDDDFNSLKHVKRFHIKYSKDEAQAIFNKFHGGHDLFDHDHLIEDAIKVIYKAKYFTQSQFEQAVYEIAALVPANLQWQFGEYIRRLRYLDMNTDTKNREPNSSIVKVSDVKARKFMRGIKIVSKESRNSFQKLLQKHPLTVRRIIRSFPDKNGELDGVFVAKSTVEILGL